jgi:hypothetical protein
VEASKLSDDVSGAEHRIWIFLVGRFVEQSDIEFQELRRIS